jgi:Icc-related predicted phosphoesterase
MKINLVSDLHLNFEDLSLPGGEVLILSGDIMEAGHLRLADNAKKDTFIADRYRRFIDEELVKYSKVFYVAGNHEHYHNSYDDTHNRIRRELPNHVSMLEAEAEVYEGVHFFGGTFWTDCNKGDPITLSTLAQNMADYRVIRHGDSIKVRMAYGGEYYTNRFVPAYTKGVFHTTVEALRQYVEGKDNEKIVVISHHAPTPLSCDPYYKDEYHMNGGYFSNLFDFIADRPQIKFWTHGHTHQRCDYQVGDTRIMCNARGYAGYEDSGFDINFTFEV